MSDLFSLPFVEDTHGCSRAGAEYALPNAGTQLARVYSVLEQEGPLTDRQLEDSTGIALSIICARRNELVKRGLIESVGTILGAKGVPNNLWAVVKGGVGGS